MGTAERTTPPLARHPRPRAARDGRRCTVLALAVFALFISQIKALPKETESRNRLYFVGVPTYAP